MDNPTRTMSLHIKLNAIAPNLAPIQTYIYYHILIIYNFVTKHKLRIYLFKQIHSHSITKN